MPAYTLTRLTPIDAEAILPLAEARQHLRVTHTGEDTLIASLRNAACEYVERVSGIALASANYRWEGSSFARVTGLPMRPVTAIVEVGYHDSDGEAATYTGARLVNGVVYPAVNESWPSSYGYASVTFAAGADCPPDLLAAVKLMLTHLFENRSASSADTVKEIPLGVMALIDTYRRVMV